MTTHCIYEVQPLIERVLMSKLTPFLWGSPGQGKSSLVKDIANKFNLELIDLRLSQLESVDLHGFPYLEGKKGSYKPMDIFPLENDPIPEGKNGWMLFLDEANAAELPVQKASYRLILDKEVGNHKLHPNTVMMAAGNLDTDNALVESMSTALQSRMIHFHVETNPNNWLKWANNNSLDHRIVGFLGFRPSLLMGSVEHEDHTLPTPRTWHFLSNLLKSDDPIEIVKSLAVATVGEGAGNEFTSFCDLYQSLPKWEELVMNPDRALIPQDPATCYAVSSLIGERVQKENLENILNYIRRLPKEFQVITTRNVLSRRKELITHPALMKWVADNATDIAA